MKVRRDGSFVYLFVEAARARVSMDSEGVRFTFGPLTSEEFAQFSMLPAPTEEFAALESGAEVASDD